MSQSIYHQLYHVLISLFCLYSGIHGLLPLAMKLIASVIVLSMIYSMTCSSNFLRLSIGLIPNTLQALL
nr:MAG TPA: hypothetical protein [Caudoviricetes sp.]